MKARKVKGRWREVLARGGLLAKRPGSGSISQLLPFSTGCLTSCPLWLLVHQQGQKDQQNNQHLLTFQIEGGNSFQSGGKASLHYPSQRKNMACLAELSGRKKTEEQNMGFPLAAFLSAHPQRKAGVQEKDDALAVQLATEERLCCLWNRSTFSWPA